MHRSILLREVGWRGAAGSSFMLMISGVAGQNVTFLKENDVSAIIGCSVSKGPQAANKSDPVHAGVQSPAGQQTELREL